MKNVTRDMIGREEEMHNINMDRQNVRTIGLQFSKLPGTKHQLLGEHFDVFGKV